MITVEPTETSVAKPDVLPIVATEGVPLTQVPPDGVPIRVVDVVPEVQSPNVPEITGAGLTVTTLVIELVQTV